MGVQCVRTVRAMYDNQKHGDCNVTLNREIGLVNVTGETLSEDRTEKQNSIGFIWRIRFHNGNMVYFEEGHVRPGGRELQSIILAFLESDTSLSHWQKISFRNQKRSLLEIIL